MTSKMALELHIEQYRAILSTFYVLR